MICEPDMDVILPAKQHIRQVKFGLSGGGIIERPSEPRRRESSRIESKCKIYCLASLDIYDDKGEQLAQVSGAAIPTKYIVFDLVRSERIVSAKVDTDGFDTAVGLHFLVWSDF